MRTRLLGLAAVAGLVVVAASPQPTARPAGPERPNIVFILTDDLDIRYPDGTWLEDFPGLQAQLADRGTTFSNMFVSLSLCCPSRSSILRGQYAHNTQIFTNEGAGGGFQKAHDLGLEESTMATWLQDSGYRTVLLGKYLNGYPGNLGKSYVPPGWDEWYGGEAGQYNQFNYDLNENGTVVHYGSAPEDYLQDVLDAKAVDFIQRGSAAGARRQPFFMWMTTLSPHMPAAFAPRHAGAFLDAQAPRPPTFNEEDVSGHPQWVQNRPLLTDAEIDQIDVLYRKRLRSMLAVQDTVRDLIRTLRQTGQLDNTYIFFSSDNGFHLGQHRLNPGKNTEFGEDLHVPLIVRGPGVPAGRVVDNLALNIDFAPTFAELAGIPIPKSVDGRSLMPLLGPRPPDRWRQAFLIEHGFVATGDVGRTPADVADNQEPPDPFDLALPVLPQPFHGVHTLDLAYTEYLTTGEVELYYLTEDPYEHTSIAGVDPELDAFLASWLARLRDCVGAGCRAAEDDPPFARTARMHRRSEP